MSATPRLTAVRAHGTQPPDTDDDYIRYADLLDQAHGEGLCRVQTELVQAPTDDNGNTAIVKATVSLGKGVFDGLGDANPNNVNTEVLPHLIRVAETRAKARALRDAVNVGVTSFEELGGRTEASAFSTFGTGAPSAPGFPAAAPRFERNGYREGMPVQRSGARNGWRSRQTNGTSNGAGNGAANSRPYGNGAVTYMTAPQRKYLFRILQAQGVDESQSTAFLADQYGIENVDALTRKDASKLIDAILAEAGNGHAHN